MEGHRDVIAEVGNVGVDSGDTHVFAGGGVVSLQEPTDGASTPCCGMLAIVPLQSELQLAPQNGTYSEQPCRSQYGPLDFSDVCPTCHRPLKVADMDDMVSSSGEHRFTPQYFRTLVDTHAQQLRICDSPSSLQGRNQKEFTKPLLLGGVHGRHSEEQNVDVSNAGTSLNISMGEDYAFNAPMTDRHHSDDRSTNSSGGGYYKLYFREIQKLGNGTFGGVYLCQHVMENVALGYFALKKIPVGDNSEYLQKVLSEVRILEEVKRHPNVVEYNHSWVDIAQLADFGPPVRCLFILMEYATMGSLDSYLERHGRALPTIAVWYFFLSAVAGTAHLHQKNILHRDLKPQNLLLTGAREKPPRVLVSDFGTATLLGELSYERTGGTGTVEYMAPELFECVPGRDGTYFHSHTKATDMYSLGMILYYLACDGTLPLCLPNGELLLDVAERATYPRPPEMVELIRSMLHRNPSKRPTCQELLKSTVVQTILSSFEKVNLFSDILPTSSTTVAARRKSATRTGTSMTTPSSEKLKEDMELFRGKHVIPNKEGTVQPPKQKKHLDEDAELSAPYSPVEEVPLILQYKTQESRRSNTSIGFSRGRGRATESRAVQTDYVKIVYE